MDKFDIKDKECKEWAVYLDGALCKGAIFADAIEGYVILLRQEPEEYWGYINNKNEYEKKYGRIHIVKMEEYELDSYRETSLIKKYHST